MIPLNTVVCMGVMEFLALLPDNCVHVVPTSPPYWAVRSYPIPPSFWCCPPDCDHEWEDCGKRRVRSTVSGVAGFATDTGKPDLHRQRVEWPSRGRLCKRCGGWHGTLGMEPTPSLFVRHMVEVFAEIRRVLHPSGSVWMNLGDGWAMGSARRATEAEIQNDLQRVKNRGYLTNAFGGNAGGWDRSVGTAVEGLKAKDLINMPGRVADALRDAGWWLRDKVIWEKIDPVPCGVWDKLTNAHEEIFRLCKVGGAPIWRPDRFPHHVAGTRCFYDREAIRLRGNQTMDNPDLIEDPRTPGYESSRLPRTVWRIRAKNDVPRVMAWDRTLKKNKKLLEHFATFPLNLVRPMILSCSSEHGVCPTCGEPWYPLYVPHPDYMQILGESWHGHEGGIEGDLERGQTAKHLDEIRDPYLLDRWAKGCTCAAADPVPALVMDPFMGLGTVGEMAVRQGRNVIGCDINPTWARFATERIAATAAGHLPERAGRAYAMAGFLSGQGGLFDGP